jgi:hypothetical protein
MYELRVCVYVRMHDAIDVLQCAVRGPQEMQNVFFINSIFTHTCMHVCMHCGYYYVMILRYILKIGRITQDKWTRLLR